MQFGAEILEMIMCKCYALIFNVGHSMRIHFIHHLKAKFHATFTVTANEFHFQAHCLHQQRSDVNALFCFHYTVDKFTVQKFK